MIFFSSLHFPNRFFIYLEFLENIIRIQMNTWFILFLLQVLARIGIQLQRFFLVVVSNPIFHWFYIWPMKCIDFSNYFQTLVKVAMNTDWKMVHIDFV